MGKLIELLNEREIGEEGGELYYLSNGIIRDDGGNILYSYRIISKEFGFIKWLVDNDKIDREKFGNSETKSSKYSDYELSYDTPREDYTNILLMELAIQDEPINFLISILK